MKRILISILLTFGLVSTAYAQTPTAQDLAVGCGLPAVNCTSSIANMTNGTNAASFTSVTITTGNSTYSTAGKQPIFSTPPVYTPDTAYPTPASAKFITGRYGILAAGAPTAAYLTLPQATAQAKTASFGVFNQGSNPLAIVPYPGDTLNVSAAATPFSCTTLKYCECTVLTATNYGCRISG